MVATRIVILPALAVHSGHDNHYTYALAATGGHNDRHKPWWYLVCKVLVKWQSSPR